MKLLELRKNANKNQQDLANYLNVARSTYNGYELENYEPNIETLIKIANYYNVSLDYLVERNFKNDLGFISDEQRKDIELYLKLNKRNQEKAQIYMLGLYTGQDEKGM